MTVRFQRRLALLHVSDQQLERLLRLPADVTIRGLTVDHLRSAVTFVVESDRFEPTLEAAEPPALIGNVESGVDGAGVVTQRVTWDGLEGAEVLVRSGGDNYRHRDGAVRARQWLGTNEAEIQELTGADFYKVDPPADEDPDATGCLLTGPHNVWELVLDGDWIVQHGDGWVRMTDEEFVAEYEPVPA